MIHSLRPDPINEENNSLISGMTNVPLANISDDISLPTEWLGYLHPTHIKQLNKIPIPIRDELISSVDGYAKSHLITNTNTAILYAHELIDDYYLSNKIRPPLPTTKSSQSSDKIIPLPDVMLEDKINIDIIFDTTIIPKSPPADDQSIVKSVSRVFMNELKEQKKS